MAEEFPGPPAYGQSTTAGAAAASDAATAEGKGGNGGASGEAAAAVAVAEAGAVDEVNPRVFALFREVCVHAKGWEISLWFHTLYVCIYIYAIPILNPTPPHPSHTNTPTPPTTQVKGLVLALVEDLTVLRLYIRLASPAIADGTFNSAVQARDRGWSWMKARWLCIWIC